MNEILGDLCRNLDREIEARTGLLELIRLEGKTIRSGNHEELGSIVGSIRSGLDRLRGLEEERGGLLDRTADLLGLERKGMTLSTVADRVAGSRAGAIREKRDALREVLRETLRRNHQIQYILRFASDVVQDTLDLVMQDPGTDRKIYGPGGEKGRTDRHGSLFRAKV